MGKNIILSARFRVACCLAIMTSLLATGCIVTPQPLTEDDHFNRFLSDKAELAGLQNAASAPVTIEEAIARTVHYNLDNRLAQMEEAFSLDQLSAAKLQMLPRLALNAGYSMRNNESASTSISYEKRTISLEPSVSTEKARETADLSFSWSLLDFGIGYFQAKQQANRYLILVERRRRLMNNLVKEVIIAYYRVASLERIHPQVEESLAEAQAALETYRRIEETRTSSVVQALEQQRLVINLMTQLRQLTAELAISRSRLAALMNLPQDAEYQLASHDIAFDPPQLSTSLNELEDIGVFLRPDLREESYQERVDKDEVKKELLRLFPGVTAFGGANYDGNKYLANHNWYEMGARATLDIIGTAARYKQWQAAKKQTEVAKIRRLAGTVAAMLQIDMSYYQYANAISVLADSKELNRIDGRLLEIRSAEAETRAIGRLDHILQNVASVNSQLDADRKTVDVLVAWANLFFSIGGDILGDLSNCDTLESLTAATGQGLADWLNGRLPSLPDRPEFRSLCIASNAAYGLVTPAAVEFSATVPEYFVPAEPVEPAEPTEAANADRIPESFPAEQRQPPTAAASATRRFEERQTISALADSATISTDAELFELMNRSVVYTVQTGHSVGTIHSPPQFADRNESRIRVVLAPES